MDETEDIITTPVRPVRPQKQDRTTLALLLVAAMVAVGGLGFAAGHLTASPTPGAQPTFARGGGGFGRGGGGFPSLAPGQTFNPGQFGGGFGGGTRGFGGVTGGISGTVQSIDGSTMTIQLASGQTVTVDLSGSTTYHSTTPASADQVKVGSSVTVEIDTSALASESPNPSATGVLGGREISAKDVLIKNP
jgi:hypothetical protein